MGRLSSGIETENMEKKTVKPVRQISLSYPKAKRSDHNFLSNMIKFTHLLLAALLPSTPSSTALALAFLAAAGEWLIVKVT